ncbi:MAG: hypothetical protein SFY68_07980 [Candidatus Sumerlaeia bacterium]|nr:hypothetical protein [Candidatus Sumerlaeia bacterium]
MNNKFVTRLFLKTLWVSLFFAALFVLRVDYQWGGAYSIGSAVGFLNWAALAAILLGVTSRKPLLLLAGVLGKFLAWGLIISLVLSPYVQNISALLLGLTTFLAVVVLEALGAALTGKLSSDSLTTPPTSNLSKGHLKDA